MHRWRRLNAMMAAATVALVLAVVLGASSGHSRTTPRSPEPAAAASVAAVAPAATCFTDGGGRCGANACAELIAAPVQTPGSRIVLGSPCRAHLALATPALAPRRR